MLPDYERPPNPHLCTLALAFGTAQIRSLLARLAPNPIPRIPSSALREHWRTRPDTRIVKEAEDFVRASSPDFLTNHCLRSYYFAKGLANRFSIRPDDEILYLACLLHDLGLVEPHAEGSGNFEDRGAVAAHGFLRSRRYPAERANRIADAIAWHAMVGKASARAAETALTHLGTGMDVIGFNAHAFDAGFVDELIHLLPRLGFKKAFLKLLRLEAARNPHSRIGKYLKLGFGGRIANAPFPD